MAAVVTCVCLSSPVSNDDGGCVQVDGFGHFSNVLYSLCREEYRRCYLYLMTCSHSHVAIHAFSWIPDLAYFDTENRTVFHKNTQFRD